MTYECRFRGYKLRKQFYLLVGPKGAGKTHIGTLVGKNTPITFLAVEPIWLGLKRGAEGWTEVRRAIARCFENTNEVMVETLGVGEGFEEFFAALGRQYEIKLIRVTASPDVCLRRVKTRDSTNHIAVSDAKVAEYNRLATAVEMEWDGVIDNTEPTTEEVVLRVIARLRQQGKESERA